MYAPKWKYMVTPMLDIGAYQIGKKTEANKHHLERIQKNYYLDFKTDLKG